MSRQEKFDRRKAAAEKAAEKDKQDKADLVKKVNQRGGAGKLSRKEIALARRMEEGEGSKKKLCPAYAAVEEARDS